MTNRHDWVLGSSSSTAKGLTKEIIEDFAKNGVKMLEVSHNIEYLTSTNFFESYYKEVDKYAKDAGVKLHSFHVPFSGSLSISQLDSRLNANTVDVAKKCIEKTAYFGGKTVVVHSSSEPIKTDENRAAQLETSIKTLAVLAEECKKCGLKICVENLPRTCLLNNSFEALTYLNSVPDAYLCFDTNHLLMQTNDDFLDDLIDNGMQGRIATIHASDYYFIDECHLLPGCGTIDWKSLISKLEILDYDGVFMYEVGSVYTGPDNTFKPEATPEEKVVRNLGDLKANYEMLMKN